MENSAQNNFLLFWFLVAKENIEKKLLPGSFLFFICAEILSFRHPFRSVPFRRRFQPQFRQQPTFLREAGPPLVLFLDSQWHIFCGNSF